MPGRAPRIGIHSPKERRYICHWCRKTFAATTGTVFYRRRTPAAEIVDALGRAARGQSARDIAESLDHKEETVGAWIEAGGAQVTAFHQARSRKLTLERVQMDELWGFVGKNPQHLTGAEPDPTAVGVRWVGIALKVRSRFVVTWHIAASRDKVFGRTFVGRVKACSDGQPPLFETDGCEVYEDGIRWHYKEKVPLPPGERAKPGRPRLRLQPTVCLAQVIKQYRGRRLIKVEHRLRLGSQERVDAVIQQTHCGTQVNTSYIERFNGTARDRVPVLARRTYAFARSDALLTAQIALALVDYTWCTYHTSLGLPVTEPGRKWRKRTPAMAEGLTDHKWTLADILWTPIPTSSTV